MAKLVFLRLRLLYSESHCITLDARKATLRSKRLVEASLLAIAAATVLIDDAKIEQIERRMDHQPAALSR